MLRAHEINILSYLDAAREIQNGEVGFEELLQQESRDLMAKPEGQCRAKK